MCGKFPMILYKNFIFVFLNTLLAMVYFMLYFLRNEVAKNLLMWAWCTCGVHFINHLKSHDQLLTNRKTVKVFH